MKRYERFLIISLLVYLALMMSSCLRDNFKDYNQVFYIDQGDHKSTQDAVGINIMRPSIKTKGIVKFRARFTESCFYDRTLLGADSMDINKLFGLTDSFSRVHEHSARVGWRAENDTTISLFAYSYSDGVRTIVPLGEAKPYESLYFEIDLRGSEYKFTHKEFFVKTPRSKDTNKGSFFRLFPYFGGNQTAPNDMMLYIREY